jgi:hypothetical protein
VMPPSLVCCDLRIISVMTADLILAQSYATEYVSSLDE